MTERKRGIYRHPDRGLLDVFRDTQGVWMYALPGEVGDVPEDWWSVLSWEGPRVYPPPIGLNPDMGTFAFLSSTGRWEGYFCNRCGVSLPRYALPDDQWPSTACPWCASGRLISRLFDPGEEPGDQGPPDKPSPYRGRKWFLTQFTWAEADAHLAAWRTRVAARQAGGPGWVFRDEVSD